jgi:hypothetical protein
LINAKFVKSSTIYIRLHPYKRIGDIMKHVEPDLSLDDKILRGLLTFKCFFEKKLYTSVSIHGYISISHLHSEIYSYRLQAFPCFFFHAAIQALASATFGSTPGAAGAAAAGAGEDSPPSVLLPPAKAIPATATSTAPPKTIVFLLSAD